MILSQRQRKSAPTGTAATVGATMTNTTDTIAGPALIWDCVQPFDTTVTYSSINNKRRRGEFDMAAPISLRGDFDGPMLRALVLAEKAESVTRRLLSFVTIYDGGSRADAARLGAWGCRPFAIGSSGSISGGRMASSTASRPGIPRNSMTSKGARLSQWSMPVRPRRSMGSCAGG